MILLGFGRKGMNEKKENVRERTSDERKLNWSLGSDECSCAAFVGCFRYYSQVAFSCSVFFFCFLFIFIFGVGLDFGLLFSHVAFFGKRGLMVETKKRGEFYDENEILPNSMLLFLFSLWR